MQLNLKDTYAELKITPETEGEKNILDIARDMRKYNFTLAMSSDDSVLLITDYKKKYNNKI